MRSNDRVAPSSRICGLDNAPIVAFWPLLRSGVFDIAVDIPDTKVKNANDEQSSKRQFIERKLE